MAILPEILLGTALGEFCFWTFDPLGVHTCLNDNKPLGVAGLAAGTVNSLPLLLTYYGIKQKRQRVSEVSTPLMLLFVYNQWSFWWWPYLLGDLAGLHDMIAEHKVQLSSLPRLLPPIGNHLIPDNEHALLMPLSMLCVAAATSRVKIRKGSWWFILSSLFAAFAPLGFLLNSKQPLQEFGPMLTCAAIASTCGVLYYHKSADTAPEKKER